MTYHGHLKAPWQDAPENYLGKHTRLTRPATAGIGYPKPAPVYSFQDPQLVSRAIPADGNVTDPGPSWQKSPQARFWLEPEPKSIIPTLILRTLKKAARWWSISTARRKY